MYRHRQSVTSCMSVLDTVDEVVDLVMDGYSLRLMSTACSLLNISIELVLKSL